MKIAACLCLALSVAMFSGEARAAEGDLDQAQLSAMGLASLTPMTEAEGAAIRGNLAIAFGYGRVGYKSDGYFDAGKRHASGSFSVSSSKGFAFGKSSAWAR